MADYTPKPGSLAARVVAWFRSSMDEELSAADIGLKFDCVQTAVCAGLEPAVTHGLLAQNRRGRNAIYSAGQVLKDERAANGAAVLAAGPWVGKAPSTTGAPPPKPTWRASRPRPRRTFASSRACQCPPARAPARACSLRPWPPA